jgi:hypothetical protein
MLKLTNTKTIISGSTIEVYSYPAERPLAYNFTVGNIGRIRNRNTGTDTESLKRKALSGKRSARRAVLELRKLVNANVWRYISPTGVICAPLFVTFTFSDEVRGMKTANRLFLKFIHRLNYRLTNNAKYISVIGFQDMNRDGVVHYHTVFFNISPEQEILLSEAWKLGNVDIKKVQDLTAEDSENIGLYMAKHITVSSGDSRFDGHKRYFASRGLYKAVEIRDQHKAQSIVKFIPSEYVPKQYSFSGFQGKITCFKYKLNKGEVLADIAPEIKQFL